MIMWSRWCDGPTFASPERRAEFNRAVMMVVRCVGQLYALTSRVKPSFGVASRAALDPRDVLQRLYDSNRCMSACQVSLLKELLVWSHNSACGSLGER